MVDEKEHTLTEIIEEAYKIALKNGISAISFWEMTYGEIIDTVRAYQEEKIEDMKFKALLTYKNGELTARSIGVAFNGSKFPLIHEVFPSLFEVPTPKQQDAELIKARMLEYADYWNKKYKKESEVKE